MRECKELYGARDATTYEEVMAKAKVCHHKATYRISIPGFAVIYRCGMHAKGYRLADNTVEAIR